MSKTPEYRGAVCRGSYAAGNACGMCERCAAERDHLKLWKDVCTGQMLSLIERDKRLSQLQRELADLKQKHADALKVKDDQIDKAGPLDLSNIATNPSELDRRLCDSSYAKSELEWHAARKVAELKEVNAQLMERAEELEVDAGNVNLKDYCTNFFRWWWNQPGTNAEDGYDEWRELGFPRTGQPEGEAE